MTESNDRANDRLERQLESLRGEMTSVREAIAGLVAGLNAHFAEQGRQRIELEALRTAQAAHEKATADFQGEHRSEVRRLWWAISFALTGAAGASGAAVTSLMGGG